MTMATRLAVMHHGYLAQVGTPAEVYEYPQTRLVAEFLGTANVFEGIVREAGAAGALVEATAFDAEFQSDTDPPKPAGARVFIAVRPEKMRVRRAGDDERAGRNRLVGSVRDIAYYGDFFMFVVDLPGGGAVRVSQPNQARITELPITWGDRVVVEWPPLATVVLPE